MKMISAEAHEDVVYREKKLEGKQAAHHVSDNGLLPTQNLMFFRQSKEIKWKSILFYSPTTPTNFLSN